MSWPKHQRSFHASTLSLMEVYLVCNPSNFTSVSVVPVTILVGLKKQIMISGFLFLHLILGHGVPPDVFMFGLFSFFHLLILGHG